MKKKVLISCTPIEELNLAGVNNLQFEQVDLVLKRKLCPADLAIAATFIGPFIFDMWVWRKGYKTFSIRFGEFLLDPKTRTILTAWWFGLTAHLFWGFPLPGGRKLKTLVTYKRIKDGAVLVSNRKNGDG